MTDATQERVDKIQKLLNKAEGASTEEEAAAFFSKAEELMVRYSIDDAMLQATGATKKEEVVVERITLKTSYFMADIDLATAVAYPNNCKILQNKQAHRIVFIGFESEVKRVITLFLSLHMQAARFARLGFRDEVSADEKQYMTAMDKHVWKRSFRTGFAYRVGERLWEQVKATTQEAAKTHGSGMELVLVDRKQEVEDVYNANTGGVARRGNARADYQGLSAGKRAADRADVGQTRVGGRKALS